ncbi:platelet endothelial cell adhesion molecule [Thunnus albacares]|uniref:platelet endothelial cell adhesion molecule n=1 Tax=Thunnus albacares TaxID=8236 RepID=UPI001CF6945B|nr:platelet endothelial cell adhesion molecule [Thunnus albacares]
MLSPITSSRMFLFVVMLGLCFFSKESSQLSLERPELFGPSVALVGKSEDFYCGLQIYPKNEQILLQLFKEGNRTKLLGESTSLDGQVGTIPLLIKPYHEGNLECVAKAQNNSDIEPTVSNKHYLRVIEPVEGAEIVHSGPVEFFEGRELKLRCELKTGNHVSYKWLLNDRPVARSPHHYVADNRLSINRTTSADSGSYICVAVNQYNQTEVYSSTSPMVVITVKDVVSDPDISFTVLKEDSHHYSAVVTCQSTRGTLPVTFSLYNGTGLVANVTVEERKATFKTPLVLGQHLGWLQCQAKNGDRVANSRWLPLEVVPVGGPVTIDYDSDIGENYAVTGLRLYCKVAKGTLPRYQWFLNKTLLHDQGSFYHVVNRPPKESILLLAVGRSSAGTYHCEVSDSFDNTTTISSKSRYLDKEVLNRLPDLVVAMVFGCFTLLVLLVSILCWIGVLFRKRQYGEKSLLGLEMERKVAAYENELDLSEYDEDADGLRTARDDEFDQVSAASVDEWSLYGEEEDEQLKEP